MSNLEIWKYPLWLKPEQTILVPVGSRPLTVQTQDGTPCLWAEVDSSATFQDQWTVHSVMTGQVFPAEGVGDYVGTLLLNGDALVVHIYVTRPEEWE